MRKNSLWILALLLCMCMNGCNSNKYWIRKNIHTEPILPMESSAPATIQTQPVPSVPDQLQMDGSVIREENLRFGITKEMLCNDLGYYLQRQITEDYWLPETGAVAPYSRAEVQSQRLDLDPLLKNDPLICVYLDSGRLYEVGVILLTHDWTVAGEQIFVLFTKTLLQCFWPQCGADAIDRTVADLFQDIEQNAYPDTSDAPVPTKIYVHESAAAYSYTHGNHIGILVIPVDEIRLEEWRSAGLEIVEIR